MKKVFMGLAVVCLVLGLIATIQDADGTFLFVGILFAALFGFLAWLWRGKSPIKRTGEQIANVVELEKRKREDYKGLAKPMKVRYWKFRIAGAVVFLLGVFILCKGYGMTVTICIATVVMIAGIAIWGSASPENYNSLTDMGVMISMDRPRTIEEFYEAYKNVKTPLGSGYLVKFRTMKQKALMFGPDDKGQYLYFWLTKDGYIGYIGYSFLNMIKEKYNEPLIPIREDFGDNVSEYLCYTADVLLMERRLKESFEYYIKNGQALPIEESLPSEVYTFNEDFKLTGQHFELHDKDDNLVYEIDGTMPLLSLRIFDSYHNEIFKMTKEVGHALATYRFYYRGDLYGTFEKQFTLVRDKFAMQINDGRLELTEIAGSIGHNFSVTLNGRLIGMIMDNLDITLENIFFDNAVIVVYDEKYLPLITAMAVMVARELARDEDGALPNRI